MRLYEIKNMSDEAIKEAIDENGEIIDERLIELLEELNVAKEQKVENIIGLINDIKKEQKKFDDEIDRLKKKSSVFDSKVAYWKSYIAKNIEVGEKFKFVCGSLYWKPSQSVNVLSDIEDFRKQYPDLVRAKITYEPNKDAIAARIESGELVIGAEIVNKQNLVIK